MREEEGEERQGEEKRGELEEEQREQNLGGEGPRYAIFIGVSRHAGASVTTLDLRPRELLQFRFIVSLPRFPSACFSLPSLAFIYIVFWFRSAELCPVLATQAHVFAKIFLVPFLSRGGGNI